MKKNFLKVFSLLLVISMLAISVSAVVTDKPQSDITIAAPEQVTLYGDSATVTVTLTMPTCYAIEGQWTATDGLTMDTLVADNGIELSNDGVVVWADVEGDNQNGWFKNPMTQMTATYTVKEAGTYTVTFTCTVFAGGQQITNGDIAVVEGTFVYSKTIQVVKHVCSDVTTDNDHICDDTNCGKTVGDHTYSESWTTDETNHWHVCDCGAQAEEAAHADTATKDHKCDVCDYVMSECADGDDADHKCDHCGADSITEHDFGTEWKSDGEKHWKECACGEKNEVADHSDVTTDADHKCDVCEKENVTEHKHNTYGSDETQHWSICDCGQQVGEKVNHDFTNGDCICGAEKPVTNVAVTAKGTINHTVEGQVVTVTHSVACKVGYWDETEGKYIAIAAVANDDGSYSFTAPEGVTEVLLVAKGDVNGDGKCNVLDRAKIAKNTLKNTHDKYEALVELWMVFAGDIDNNGTVNVLDRAKVAKHTLKNTHDKYEALTW